MFNQKHSFHPTTYSERPAESPYLYTQPPPTNLYTSIYDKSVTMAAIPFTQPDEQDGVDGAEAQLRLTSTQFLDVLNKQNAN